MEHVRNPEAMADVIGTYYHTLVHSFGFLSCWCWRYSSLVFFFLATTLFTTSHLWSEGVSSGGNKEEVIQKQALVFRRRPHLLRSRTEHKRPFAVTKDDVLLTNVYTLEKVCSAWSAVSSPQNNRLLHQSLLVERKTTTQWCIFFNKMLSHVDCSYES